jgi:hypothetical protein
MKKSLLAILAFAPASVFAQAGTDTLIYEDFETDPAAWLMLGTPAGIMGDTFWYNCDNDLLPDASGGGRPDEWYWGTPFADVDTVGNTGVLTSNSWTNDGTTHVANWLITPSIHVADTTLDLFWKSAPFQTPRYLDGYIVLVSTATNDFSMFTDTLFVASEYVALAVPASPNQFTSYTYAPVAGGFVHGEDWTYIEDNGGDSTRWRGILRPQTVDLSAYVGQNIYIAIVHWTVDDNLLSIDEIFLEGTGTVGIAEHDGSFPMGVYPNPANDMINVNYHLPAQSQLLLNVYSMDGQLVRSEDKGTAQQGNGSLQMNVSDLAAGIYFVQLQTEHGSTTKRIVVE